MNSAYIFSLGLGIEAPWEIQKISFKTNKGKKELHIEIGYVRGTKFPDETGALCPVYDTQKRTWRHLNFFEHKTYLTCKVPRIETCSGKVRLVNVPWSRENSGFTLLFEAYVMALIEHEMPVNKAGKLVDENAHRLWTIFNYWIERAYSKDAPKKIERLGLDETSRRKGHSYITVAADLDERRVIHVAEGKGKAAVGPIKDYFLSKGLSPSDVEHVSMDMSPSFISGTLTHFEKAAIHFDRFHVVKLLNEAMDTVRKQERLEHKMLKGHKYTFLKNKDKLSKAKKKALGEFIILFPVLGEAYRLKELFNDLWEQETEEEAILFLEDWFEQVETAGIEAFKRFSKTVKLHRSGIINFCGSRINNGLLEGINSKIQLAKKRARGFRLTKNFINMIYFLCGKLTFDYPLYSS